MAPQAPGNSTTIAGNVTDEVCLDRATFLIYDNYGREPANLEPESRQALAEVDTYWNREPGDFLFEDLDSGLYASLFTPKDGNQCPPTLVMRGTQFPDARGIVLAIRMTAAPSLAPNLQLPLDLAIAVESIKQAMPDFRTSESFWETAGIAASLVSTDVESLKTNGTWTEIFSARGVHMEGVTRIPLAFGPLRHIPGAEYALIVTLTARAEIWLNHNQRDWPANVLQGMGRRTDQYDSDLKNVAREVGPIVMERYDGNLRICGRSLGGGLTSAIALYLRENYPDMNIWGLTYDSSGLNHCTAERLGSSLSRASEVNIVARSVEDEILTSMQQRSDFVPVASSLIRFTGPRMPEALGTKDPRKGVSPGIMGDDAKAQGAPDTYGPKWSRMPNLHSFETQDLVPDKPDGQFAFTSGFSGPSPWRNRPACAGTAGYAV